MKYYPVFMDMNGRDCLVVGGGPVGVRKAKGLAQCGAKVTLISVQFFDGADALSKEIDCHERKYTKDDICGRFFVFAATDNKKLNLQIKKDAQKENILCNIADAPDESDFLLPSTIQRGDLILAVSTCGASPAMAKTIKKDLAEKFGPEYEIFLKIMGALRKDLLARGHAPDKHRKIFYELIEKDILGLIKADDKMKINLILNDVLGNEYSIQDLLSENGFLWRSDR